MKPENQNSPAPVAVTPSGPADDPVCSAALGSSKTPFTQHPKAEEMATEIVEKLPGDDVKAMSSGGYAAKQELIDIVSLALTPPLEEVERLKAHAFESANRELHLNEQLSAFKSERNLLADYHTTACCERDEAREKLTATEEKLKIVATDMRVVLNTWLATFAPEFCGEDTVNAAFKRINDAGGTVGYITDVDQKLSTFLATIQPTAETKGTK